LLPGRNAYQLHHHYYWQLESTFKKNNEEINAMKNSSTILIALSLLLTMLVAGCSSQVAKEENYGGFLNDYGRLTEMESSDGVEMLGWRKPGLDLSQYHSIVVDAVVISPKASIGDGIDPAELAKIQTSLHQKMVTQISKVLPVVEQAGPGVMVYSLALAGADTVNPDLSWYQYTPITYAATKAAEASGARGEVVELWVEAKITDGASGDLLATAVRRGHSKDTVDSDEEVDAADVDSILDEWANSSRVSLQDLKK